MLLLKTEKTLDKNICDEDGANCINVQGFNGGIFIDSYVTLSDRIGEFMRFETCKVAVKCSKTDFTKIISPCIPIGDRPNQSNIQFIHAKTIQLLSDPTLKFLHQ